MFSLLVSAWHGIFFLFASKNLFSDPLFPRVPPLFLFLFITEIPFLISPSGYLQDSLFTIFAMLVLSLQSSGRYARPAFFIATLFHGENASSLLLPELLFTVSRGYSFLLAESLYSEKFGVSRGRSFLRKSPSLPERIFLRRVILIAKVSVNEENEWLDRLLSDADLRRSPSNAVGMYPRERGNYSGESDR